MTRLSIEASFTWAQRFIAREWGLVVPVALAFIAVPPLALGLVAPATMQLVMTPPIKDVAEVQAALPWLLPIMLGLLASYGIGALSISALAIKPRVSVAEAILLAVRRLPVLAGSIALLFGGLVLLTFAMALLLQVAGLGLVRLQAVVLSMLAIAFIALLVRMTPLVGMIVDRRVGSIDAIRETWTIGRGVGWKMLLGLLLYNIGAMLVVLALSTALGATLLAAARIGGWSDVAVTLIAVIDRALAACAMAGSYILGAAFYRQLTAKSRA